MTIDNAIKRYQVTIIDLPDRDKAIEALAGLFAGIRAHKDNKTVYEQFAKSFPEQGRAWHVEAMEVLVLDLAECDGEGEKRL